MPQPQRPLPGELLAMDCLTTTVPFVQDRDGGSDRPLTCVTGGATSSLLCSGLVLQNKRRSSAVGFAITSVLLFAMTCEDRASALPRNDRQLATVRATSIAADRDSDLGKAKAEPGVNGSVSAGNRPVDLAKLLDLPEPPPPKAYSVTGRLLPPFLMAVLSAWQREFPDIPLSENGVILVIRPGDFYGDLDPEQTSWLSSREMLGIQNFPLIIDPLTPGDDWYFRAQREWKRGNEDAIFVLLTSLYHEITHSRRSGDELSAYKAQLEFFEDLQKRGKLRSPYARKSYKLLRDRYLDLTRHPDKYVQMMVSLGNRTMAILVRPREMTGAPKSTNH